MLPRRFVYAAPSQPTHEGGTGRMKAADAYLVITNLPDRDSAAKLAHELVEKRLAACINILSPCRSDRKSTRLNSSHGYISYAVFCLKKKKKTKRIPRERATRTSSRG